VTTASLQTAPRDWWRRADPTPVAGPDESAPLVESTTSLWAYRALLAFVTINVLSPQSFIPALEPLRLAFLSAVGAAGAHLVDQWAGSAGPTRSVPRQSTLVWCLIGWATVTIPASMWPGGSFNVLVNQYMKTVIVFWLVSSVITRTERLRTIFWTLALCSVPLGITGLKNAAGGVMDAGGTRIAGYTSGLAANPNDLALMLNILMPLTASLAFTARNRTERLGAMAIIVINAGAIVATFSRGGFITLAMTGLLSAVVLMKRRQWGLIGAGFLALVVALPAVPSSYVDRLSTILNTDADTTGSAQERIELMETAVGLVESHPLLGSGLGNDAAAINKVKFLNWRRVHNAYLVYAVDLGIPGLLIFVACLFASIGCVWRIERAPAAEDPAQRDLPTLAQGVRISLISFAVAANFSPVPYDFYFYYLAGLSVAAWHCRTRPAGDLVASAAASGL